MEENSSMGQNKDLIEQAFIGSYGANPTSGRRPLLVHFNGDPEIDELVDRGGTLMFRGDMPNGSRIAYFDTGKIGDILIALVQPTGGVETLINDQ